MSKAALFQTIQLSISTQFSSSWPIDRTVSWPIDRTLSGATPPGRSRLGSDGSKGVFRIAQKFQHFWSLTTRLFSVISRTLVEGVLRLCRNAVCVFCSPSRLGHEVVTFDMLNAYTEIKHVNSQMCGINFWANKNDPNPVSAFKPERIFPEGKLQSKWLTWIRPLIGIKRYIFPRMQR